MTLQQSLLMGLIQGLTEFLPVSSSGHLALFQIAFGIDTEIGSVFTILLHIGTLIAIFAVYYNDIIRLIVEGFKIVFEFFANIGIFVSNIFKHEDKAYYKIVCSAYRKFVMLVIVSTIPTGIIGFVGSDMVEKAEGILLIPGICLIVTAILLLISDFVPEGDKKVARISYANAFGIGICQGIATMPGLSRSGTTIAACLISGFDRKFAVKYSFIMSIPAVLGAAILKLKDIGEASTATDTSVGILLAGTLVSTIVGYIAIKLMLLIVKNKKFTFFSIYCFIIGVTSIVLYFKI